MYRASRHYAVAYSSPALYLGSVLASHPGAIQAQRGAF